MKKIGLLFLFFVSAISMQLPLMNTAMAGSAICDTKRGMFSSTKSYIAPDAYLARQSSATTWLKSMMKASDNYTGDGSTITPDQMYNYDYTGPINGTFTLASSYPTYSSTPLTVTSPIPIIDSYRGTVTGTATLPNDDTHEVRAFKFTDTEYLQPEAIPATVQPDGSWSIDLSNVPVGRAGAWHFGLFDTSTGGTQVGDYWPKPVYYTNLAIEFYSVTDAYYLSGTISEVSADNSFSFNQSYVGTKLIRLLDTNTNEVLAEYYNPTGLIRSYQYFPGETGYDTSSEQITHIYDQGLALTVAVAQNDKAWADELIDGLALTQVSSGANKGAFPFSTLQFGPTIADPIYRTGTQAIATYALLKYQETYGVSSNELATNITQDALDYLQTMKAVSGDKSDLYMGGTGAYINNVLNPDYIIPWASTENNIDAWHTLKLAGRVFKNQAYSDAADSLKDAILSKLWNHDLQRFNQGYGDTADALDINSWGAIFLNAVGEYGKAKQANANAESFKNTVNGTTGYMPYLANRGYPGTTPTIWYEGTYGLALSRFFTKGLPVSAPIINNVINDQMTGGAWRYANVEDPVYEFGTSRSVASTAWYILSAIHPEEMWAECEAPSLLMTVEPSLSSVTSPIMLEQPLIGGITETAASRSNAKNESKNEKPSTETAKNTNEAIKKTTEKSKLKKPNLNAIYAFSLLLSPMLGYLVYKLAKLAAHR